MLGKVGGWLVDGWRLVGGWMADGWRMVGGFLAVWLVNCWWMVVGEATPQGT